MLHPLVNLISTQPQLLGEHAEAYADLLAAEVGRIGTDWKRRALLNAVALCSLGVAAVLAGVALMLWSVIPAAQILAPWALVCAPLAPAVLAVACLLALPRADAAGGPAFASLRRQLQADMALLRELGTAS
jgi:hypothetical protein